MRQTRQCESYFIDQKYFNPLLPCFALALTPPVSISWTGIFSTRFNASAAAFLPQFASK